MPGKKRKTSAKYNEELDIFGNPLPKSKKRRVEISDESSNDSIGQQSSCDSDPLAYYENSPMEVDDLYYGEDSVMRQSLEEWGRQQRGNGFVVHQADGGSSAGSSFTDPPYMPYQNMSTFDRNEQQGNSFRAPRVINGTAAGNSFVDPRVFRGPSNPRYDQPGTSRNSQPWQSPPRQSQTSENASENAEYEAIRQHVCSLAVQANSMANQTEFDRIVAEIRAYSDELENYVEWEPEERGLYNRLRSETEQWGSGANYHLREVGRRYNEQFKARTSDYSLIIPPPPNSSAMSTSEHLQYHRERLQAIVHDLQSEMEPQDWVGMYIRNDRLKAGDVWLRARRADQLDAEAIFDKLYSVVQSNSRFALEGMFCVQVIHIRMPIGGSSNKRNPLIGKNLMAFLKTKTKSVILVRNTDNICLARAVVMAKAVADGDMKSVKRYKEAESTWKSAAQKLLYSVGLPERSCTLDDVKVIEQHMSDYQFLVLTIGKMFQFSHKGAFKREKQIILLHDEDAKHFHVLKTLPGFFGVGYYCIDCNVKYNDKNDHKCTRGCKMCNLNSDGGGDCEKVEDAMCEKCNRSFFSFQCFNNHIENDTCERVYKCTKCNVLVDRKKRKCKNKYSEKLTEHRCGEIYCCTCKGYFTKSHLCYITRPHSKHVSESRKKLLFIFYDFEATQETPVLGGKSDEFEHIVNYVVTKQRCEQCMECDDLVECSSCGVRKHYFESDSALQEFCEYVFTLNSLGKFEIRAVAHNSSGYDSQFIARHCFNHSCVPEKIISSGSKITYMQVRGVHFIDSFKFLPMALSKIPAAFGLVQLKKGDFPHYFNVKDNWNYVGPIPDFEFYGANSKSVSEKEKLHKWWTEMRETQYIFDFQKEIREYCESDVDILEKGCLKFRSLFMETDTDPLRESTTIASACNLLFRKKYLKPDTIGIIKPEGYSWRDNQSHMAITWLKWEEMQRGIRIQHAANGREAVVSGKKVDGYYADQKLVFEFQGCAYHGCPQCYRSVSARRKTVPYSSDRTLEQAYQETCKKNKVLCDAGFKVIEKWEHEYILDLKQNAEFSKFCAEQDDLAPINPRDAFFGGRTNATTLYYKASEGEIVSYADVCSLYPWVNKYGKYPIGHPEILTTNLSSDISQYEGVIKCKVLPPKHLYHPVLPVRLGSKLMFPLCSVCASEQSSNNLCEHSDTQRCLKGTWISDEVKKAVEKGYRVLKVYEVWHYNEVWQYIPGSGNKGLFNEYIDYFLKMKTEASGYPPHIRTEQEKDDYIQRYYQREGVLLDKNNIVSNSGLRSLAKLCLNSFWGKYGQRNNMPQVEYITHPEQLFSLLLDETRDISGCFFVSEHMVQVQWRNESEFVEAAPNTNPVIAAYTTAQARLKLYSYLEQLEKRVLYFDTDSIIYATKPGQPLLPTGEFLGELTDELCEYGDRVSIDEFVSGGPKNYAYTVKKCSDGTLVGRCCKVKGVTLNAENSTLVNFESLKHLVTEEPEKEITVTNKRIARTKEHLVVTRPESKTWRVVYNKRQKQPDYTTLPWGWCK